MKKIILFASVACLAISFISCKSKKATTASSTTNAVATETYRLKISFISKGAGPDNVLYGKITAFIDGHAKKPTNEKVNWGREGENDICMKLTELSKKETLTFIDEIKKIINGSDMVFLNENVECGRKRQ